MDHGDQLVLSPTVPDNIATFTNNPGAPTSVTIANDASINTIQFDAAAPAYSFTINNGVTFNINGTGIANSSASRRVSSTTAGCSSTRRR